MIHITQSDQCCGCTACQAACPKHCIKMMRDQEGFLYPETDVTSCVDCGLCEKVCPVLKPYEPVKPSKVYAAKCVDENIRMKSSSGGVFSLLTHEVLKENGVVFGAAFDNQWKVNHVMIESVDELYKLQGSKYVQSCLGDTFRDVKQVLLQNRIALFSGTPCQVSGLKHYLQQDYKNLITVDVVCHGVPSPLVWEDYVSSLRRPKGAAGENTVLSSLNDAPSIEGISFRDKQNGWRKYGFVVRYSADQREVEKFDLSSVNAQYEMRESLEDNLYLRGFMKNLFLRPSCYNCPAKCGKSHSDITLADFWGIEKVFPEMNDNKGVSLVMINTKTGRRIWSFLNLEQKETTFETATAGNMSYDKSVSLPKERDQFWMLYKDFGVQAINLTLESMRQNRMKRFAIWCYNIILKLTH